MIKPEQSTYINQLITLFILGFPVLTITVYPENWVAKMVPAIKRGPKDLPYTPYKMNGNQL